MYEYAIKEVVKIVDGDTVDVIIDLGFNLSKKERIRLAMLYGLKPRRMVSMGVC